MFTPTIVPPTKAITDDVLSPQQNKVTLQDILNNIVSEHYFTAGDAVAYNAGGPTVVPDVALNLLTFCVLILKNGFTATGTSACVDPAIFDAQRGRDIAKEDAMDQVWPLMGYALNSKLAEEAKA